MSFRNTKDRLAKGVMVAAACFAGSIALLMVLGLYSKSRDILRKTRLLDLLTSSTWRPMAGAFGFYPFIVGTVEVTLISMVLAVPTCLLAAIFLAEFAPSWLREGVRSLVDLMAGIPSVIYGLFGTTLVVPLVRDLGRLLGQSTTGYCLLSGGVILSLMVAPIIVAVSLEVLRSIPIEARETALSLGLTRWEVSRHVLLRSSAHGIISAVVLGFSRAFGETIAVMMVIGNVPRAPASIFHAAYTLPALIANNYGEMMSIPLYDSALMLAALILLVVVGGFNIAAHIALYGVERRDA